MLRQERLVVGGSTSPAGRQPPVGLGLGQALGARRQLLRQRVSSAGQGASLARCAREAAEQGALEGVAVGGGDDQVGPGLARPRDRGLGRDAR